MKNISVFILCGGRGSRLGEKTAEIPKPLVPVNGNPMVTYILNHFTEQDFYDVTMGTGYLSEKVEEFAKNFDTKADIRISNAGEKASMLERIHTALPNFKDETIVSYGDTFIEIDYNELVDQHRKSGAVATIITGKIKNP